MLLIQVYHDVLPIMEDIMREYGDYTEFMWGTCLHYTAFDELILNDLNVSIINKNSN